MTPKYLLLLGLFGLSYEVKGQLVTVGDCAVDCETEEASCTAETECSETWTDFEADGYATAEDLATALDAYCNGTCSDVTETFFTCLEGSDCWDLSPATTYSPDCTYYAEFTITFVVYDETGSVSSTQICNGNMNGYLTAIFGDDTVIKFQDDCDSDSGGESGEGGSEGSGEGGSGGSGGSSGSSSSGGRARRRLLQGGGEGGGEGGESGEGGSGESGESGEGGSGGGDSTECAEVTFNARIGYVTEYSSEAEDLENIASVFSTLMLSEIPTSWSTVGVFVERYNTECCDGTDCTAYSTDEDATFTMDCEVTGGSNNGNSAKYYIGNAVALALIFAALFAN